MSEQGNNHLFLKTFAIGGFIAILVYFFHPETGPFSHGFLIKTWHIF